MAIPFSHFGRLPQGGRKIWVYILRVQESIGLFFFANLKFCGWSFWTVLSCRYWNKLLVRATLPYDSIKRRKKEVPRWLSCNWKYAIERIKTKQPSLSRELGKKETQSTDCGSVLPKESLFVNIFILQKEVLSSFPSWGFSISPGLFTPI